ncbi:hypothetical protein KBC54_03075 [Patescibacteria group bacterium]|nr:hypothetical protein [Patescibacteria group bacterium]
MNVSSHPYRSVEPGYIALMSVLIVGAVSTAIASTLIILGVGFSRSSFVFQQSAQAMALAQACAEEGLQQIRDNTAYTGTGTLTLGAGSCSYTVANTGGTTRTVVTSGTVGTVVRKVSVAISGYSPRIVVTSWQEVAN